MMPFLCSWPIGAQKKKDYRKGARRSERCDIHAAARRDGIGALATPLFVRIGGLLASIIIYYFPFSKGRLFLELLLTCCTHSAAAAVNGGGFSRAMAQQVCVCRVGTDGMRLMAPPFYFGEMGGSLLYLIYHHV
jgi:hypothetical protein